MIFVGCAEPSAFEGELDLLGGRRLAGVLGRAEPHLELEAGSVAGRGHLNQLGLGHPALEAVADVDAGQVGQRGVVAQVADRNSKRMTSAGGGRRRPREGGSPRLGDPSSGPPAPRSGLGGGLARETCAG